jgi:hypothetical protein
MDERDRSATRSPPRRLVHEWYAVRAQATQHHFDVADAIAHVMDALAAPRQEAPHRCLRTEGSKQLYVRGAHGKQDLFHALVLNHLPVGRLQAEGSPIFLYGRLEIGDGDPDVIDVEQEVFHR